MNKLEVQICVGTTCYVMGASHLQDIEIYLSEEQRNKVSITGAACLNACRSGNYIAAPFVKVGDVMVSEATTSTVIAEIKRQLERKNAEQ